MVDIFATRVLKLQMQCHCNGQFLSAWTLTWMSQLVHVNLALLVERSFGSKKLTNKESMTIWNLIRCQRWCNFKGNGNSKFESTCSKCAATQGRTSKPDLPNAPPSCSTTATITGRVFYTYKVHSFTNVILNHPPLGRGNLSTKMFPLFSINYWKMTMQMKHLACHENNRTGVFFLGENGLMTPRNSWKTPYCKKIER